MVFVDFQKAFDTVSRAKLWECMIQELGCTEHTVSHIQHLYKGVQMEVKGAQDTIAYRTGVKQDCPLSPILFTLYLDQIEQYLATV